MPSSPTYTAALWGLFLVLTSGCGAPYGPISPSTPIPDGFSATGDRTVPSQWWRLLEDPNLNRLIEAALTENYSLAAVWERFQAARAVARREAGGQYPEIDAVASSELTAPHIGDDEGLSVGLAARYEIDLWGRVRAGVAAAEYRSKASLADYRTAALSLSAEIAVSYYRLVAARQQAALLRTQLETNRAVLSLIKTRLGTEQIRMVDLLRQQQLVEATRTQQIRSASEIAVLEHRLAVLTGRPPGDTIRSRDTFPPLPALPKTGLPAHLIKRRPDVLAAYLRIQAAGGDAAAAKAARFPRLTLSAEAMISIGGGGAVIRNWLASLLAELLAPLFRGGALKAEQVRAEAVLRERIETYGQAVLDALLEVEDALVQEARQQERIAGLEKQIKIVTQTQAQLRLEFINGFGDYLDILLALTSEQQLGRDLIAARNDLLAYRIALYRALAGGFATDRELPPADDDVEE